MALQGNLRDFSVTEILQLLGSQKKTGCLIMEWNTERISIYVQEGRIVSTRRPGLAKDDPLLVFLRRVHRLSDEQVRGVLSIQRESNRDLEDLLLNGRYLDAQELAAFLERQILDDLVRVARWENGTYRFDPATRWSQTPLVRLNIEGALMEAARRLDERRRFVTLFKDPHQLLGVRDLPDPNDPLSDEERELFGIIDGLHTVADVVEAAPLSEYEAYEALQRMLEAKWIEFVGRRDPGHAHPPTPRPGSMPRHRPRAAMHEISIAAVLIAAAIVLHLGWRALRPHASAAPAGDVFAAAQLRDLRFALELYRRERGAYPRHLQDLVEDRWIGPRQALLPGHHLVYRPTRDGSDYQLEVEPDR